MHLTIFLAAVFLAILSPAVNAADADADKGSCNRPTPVEAFWASIYTALYVSTDSHILNLKHEGGDAALLLYKILKNELQGIGACKAERVAFTAATGPATVETLTLLDYFDKVSAAVANVLFRNGRLDCGNAVSLSLDLYSHIKKALKGLDPSKFESQLQGNVEGIVKFYGDIGLKLDDVPQETAEEFRDQFQDKCKAADNASNQSGDSTDN